MGCARTGYARAPYDIRSWGYEPIPVETTEGKAEYVRIQRELSERSIELRERLLQGVRAVTCRR